MPGEIFGVIGPNGSGKTTMFNSVLGQIKPDAGTIELDGEDITRLSPLQLSRRGVGRTFQSLQVFGKMTVRDNLIVAAQEHRGTMAGRMFAPAGQRASGAKADALIDQFRIREVAAAPGGRAELRPAEAGRHRDGVHERSRPGAARRAVRRRQPGAGRRHPAPAQGPEPGAAPQLHRASSTTWTSSMELCHRIMVMVEGRVMAIGTPAEIRGNKQVLDAYLGN